ncbi:hypothetical protein [uncultured Enterovirga sp.]|uniref:hypothetical protein n=1 Tax=uncultured Enterovirga sp. TaxID=2026352 RepID=UPI0035C970F0
MIKVLRLAACILTAAIVAVTILPIGLRPVSSLPVSFERIGTYAVLGAAFSLSYPRQKWALLVGLVLLAGILETVQTLTGTRHGRIEDFAIKAAGAVIGSVAAVLLRRAATFRSAA